MLIKGIKGGSERGNPVLYTDTELAKETISREFSARSKFNQKRFVTNINIENVEASDGIKYTNENSYKTYTTRAKVFYSIYNLETNRVEERNKCMRVSSIFSDIKDDLGQPDTKIISFNEIEVT